MSSAIFIVGAGPGVGAAVARRFGREGHAVGLVARNRGRLEEIAAELGGDGIRTEVATADVRSPEAVHSALDELAGKLGDPDVLCVSPLPDVATIKPVVDTTEDDLAAGLELGVVGTAAAVQHVLPAMRERGTLLFTTGSAVLKPNPDRAASGIVNAAQAIYFEMLHDALAPEGIHVAHTVIVGPIGGEDGHDPDRIAELIWAQHVGRSEPRTVVRMDDSG
jgi:NAD(P)-dependent dehydrogenase (short-subunit alcohol dehydrogenase family)